MLVVPIPCLGVDRLSDTAQDTKAAEVVVLDVVGAETTKQTDSSRRGVELRKLVLLDSLPVARRGWVYGGGLEHGGRDIVGKQAIDDVGVASDLADVGHARKLVGVDIEDVFDGHGGTEQVASRGVDNTLRLAGRARGLEECQSRGTKGGLRART